ncbi:acyl-CoA dehydrogenase family protein [Methylobacterium sp. J-070]|uniref:acyl-CoA dehydrogenase family protein n=1 Tax=Methylobacterium sp. J-070 TaxID=2836650 RepID=UPI001FB9EB56|nr:acyl-CoA dehydrogenase family protein [Methylobacterium sp. J-070]MCJ2052899.1 acyl-CoA dehydrogenase family protein [Methylobacterium sp. J-070]
MDFELSEEQRLGLDAWRRFLERDLGPLAQRNHETAFSNEVARELLALTTQFGVGNGWVSEDEGGVGLDFVTSGLLFEELARWSPDVAGLAWVTEGASLKLQQVGSPELKARYLPGLTAGTLIGCSAISEPGCGSNARGVRTKAVRDGSHFRITGEKIWTSNATIADLVLLLARTGEDELTLFLLDRREHAFTTREIPKLGLNGWSMGQVILEDAVVGEEYILGRIGGGLAETMKGFERSRCFVSTLALGVARAALDASLGYAGEREQFGRKIGGFQLVQDMLARMATDLDAARLLVYRALSLMAAGRRCDTEAAMAKVYATEAAQRITSDAIQVHGAFGLTKEFPLERHFRNARMLTVPDGTTQINRLIIGRALTGLNAFV